MKQDLDNVNHGFRSFYAEKFKDVSVYQKFAKVISYYLENIMANYPILNRFLMGQLVSNLISVGFYNGYSVRKSEELAELILTQPYNRINLN